MQIKNGKAVLASREEYKSVKALDRRQMDEYVNAVYQSGFKAGKRETPSSEQTTRILHKILLETKGIGEKRAAAIEQRFGEECQNASGSNCGNRK